MLKKMIILASLIMVLLIGITNTYADSVRIEPVTGNDVTYDTGSNFYSRPIDETKILKPSLDVINGYEKVIEKDDLTLYLDRKKLNIAVLNSDGYLFYSDPNFYGFDINAYLTTGGLSEISSTLVVNGTYSTDKAKNKSPKIAYSFDGIDGFEAEIFFEYLGITIFVRCEIIDSKLRVSIPKERIKEEGYTETTKTFKKNPDGTLAKDENGMFITEEVTNTYNYCLSSFAFFQYFGCVGFDDKGYSNMINGYDFIPDGSGALSRFQYDTKFTTKITKRVYGNDYGIKTDTNLTSHLKDDITISIPMYGVCHGYDQYAFMNTILKGDGEAELVLEPFGYGQRNIQTTYFKFYTREVYSIKLATSETGSTTTISSNMYDTDYQFEYTFLNGENASYNGMAKAYKDDYLTLKDINESSDIPLGLNVLMQDYKKGLFGKNFIEMTSYKELLDIVKILELDGVKDFEINMLGYNKNGYFNNSNYKPRISTNLGSKKKYKELINYLESNGYSFEVPVDILTSYQDSKKGVVKKYNLNIFDKSSDSELFDETYLLNVIDSSNKILKYEKAYSRLNIVNINLESFSLNNYSYRYKGKNYSRSESIDNAMIELDKMSDSFSLSLNKANSYTYEYLSRFYSMETQSSGYTFITDSVPFISLILSGHTELYSKEINFVSDYNQYALRLVEFNIYPYFTITNENSSKLRYTNMEGLYTSEFSLWEETIKEFYAFVNGALRSVIGEEMIKHSYPINGLSLTEYSNGVKILVNHNKNSVTYNGITIEGLSYEVIK